MLIEPKLPGLDPIGLFPVELSRALARHPAGMGGTRSHAPAWDTHGRTQWAAVSTHWTWIREPPHLCFHI